MSSPTTSKGRSVVGWTGVVLALVLVTGASQAGVADTQTRAPFTGFSTGLAIAFGAALLGAMVSVAGLAALVVRRPRRRRDDEPVPYPPVVVGRWWQLLVAVVVLGVVAAMVVVFIAIARSSGGHGIGLVGSAPRPGPTYRQVHPVAGRTNSPSLHFLVALIVVLAIATVAVVLARIQQRRRPGHVPTRSFDTESRLTDLVEQATAHARRAIAEPGSPRAAVIGSYVAMSRVISAATDESITRLTPRRLLRKAADQGVVDRANGEVVTRLFERARFSTAPITELDRRHAAKALSGLRRPPWPSDTSQ